MTQTTTHVNACDASIWLDDDADTLTDISGSSNSVDLYFSRDIREFRVADSGSYPYRCGQWADGEIVLRAVYSTATDEAVDLLNSWFHAAGVLSARSMNVAVVGAAGTDYYYGEVVLESLRIPTDSQEPGPIPVEARLLTKGAWDVSDIMWYVDSVNGNDANNGRSSSQAFATIAAVEAVVSAGETIGLARGSEWQEQLDLTAANISVIAYGEGNRPFLNCLDVKANASFAKTGGRANVYEASLTLPAPVDAFCQVFEDSAHLEWVTSVANCDATQGSYYLTAHTGNVTLYVHASDSSNVITNGYVYEFSQRSYGLATSGVDDANLTATSLRVLAPLGGGGGIQTRRGATLTDCILEWGGKHNAITWGNTILTECQFLNAHWSAAGSTMYVYNADTALGEDVTLVDCIFQMDDYSSEPYGINGHTNIAGDFGTITFDGCSFINIEQAFAGMNDATALVISDCTFTDCRRGIIPPPTPGAGCTMTISGCTWNSTLTSQRFVSIDQATTPVTVDDCTIHLTAITDTGLVAVIAGATVTVTDNDFISHLTISTRVAIYCSSNAADLTLNRNQYHTDQNWTYQYNFTAGAAGMTWASDWNTFGPNFSTTITGTAYGTLLAHQVGTGEDLHSVMG